MGAWFPISRALNSLAYKQNQRKINQLQKTYWTTKYVT